MKDTYVQISTNVVVEASRRVRHVSLLGCVLEEWMREANAISNAISAANINQNIVRLDNINELCQIYNFETYIQSTLRGTSLVA